MQGTAVHRASMQSSRERTTEPPGAPPTSGRLPRHSRTNDNLLADVVPFPQLASIQGQKTYFSGCAKQCRRATITFTHTDDAETNGGQEEREVGWRKAGGLEDVGR